MYGFVDRGVAFLGLFASRRSSASTQHHSHAQKTKKPVGASRRCARLLIYVIFAASHTVICLAARITMSVGTRTITLQVANPTLKACSTLASILQRKLGDEAPPCSSRFRFLWAPTLFDDDTTLRELTSPLAALGLGHEALLTLSCLRRRYLSARAPLRRETLVSVGKRPQMGRQGGCCDFKRWCISTCLLHRVHSAKSSSFQTPCDSFISVFGFTSSFFKFLALYHDTNVLPRSTY